MRIFCGLVLAVCLVVFAATLVGVTLEVLDGRPLRTLLPHALILGVFGGVGGLSLSYLRRSVGRAP